MPWQEQQKTDELDIRTNAKVQIDDDIREWDYGSYEGLTSSTIRSDREKKGEGSWDIWRDGCPGGELIDDIRSRYHQKTIREPEASGTPSDVLIVAHGHILRAFAMRWIKRELNEGVSLLLEATNIVTSMSLQSCE
ncbi:MAG: hypothetical protein Q9220_000092 [cf. Caloplaca sp. 1 TL-2023]